MAGSSAAPRLSDHFPRVPAGCEAVAQTFFTCFYENGKQPKGTSDPLAGDKALDTCAAAMEAYNKCVDTAASKAPKKLFRVPEAYRVREQES
ncbi:hypothetical protein PINS_up012201 [Pythium insidiosum]|nr:hypothetical protein PINS_up012201 [Pythium insidiosum]